MIRYSVTESRRVDVLFESGEDESLLRYRRTLHVFDCVSEEMESDAGVLRSRRTEPLQEVDCVGQSTSVAHERRNVFDEKDQRRASGVLEAWKAYRTLFRNLLSLRIE